MKKARIPIHPKMSGTSTCTETQANCTPAHASAIITDVMLPMITVLPLRCRATEIQQIPGQPHPTYSQSMRTIFLRKESFGVWTRKKMNSRTRAMPHRGMLMKNSQRQEPELARAPPIGGPIALYRDTINSMVRCNGRNPPCKGPYTIVWNEIELREGGKWVQLTRQ